MRLIKTICVLFLILHTSWAGFDPSRFNFGADWDFLSKNLSGSVADGIDYATIWLNDPSFNQYWHGDMLKFCRDKGKTPVFYAYIIAKSSGLGDCDVNGGLCHKGAEYLRNNFNAIKGKYEDYAQKTSSVYGTSKPIIWLMEPDYFQYFSDGRQSVKLSYQDAATYMNEMIACVKKHLPNALFSLDISPWNNDQSSWINSFDKSKFSFMHTSGGRTEAGGDRIRYDNNNNVTWASVNQISGKCIIADDGYGQGGGSTGHDPTWDDLNNIKNRINNGVAAITQKSPRTDWGNTINSLKSSLSGNPTKCTGVVFKIAYSLTVNAGEGGTVEKSPDASAYDSGTTVTLTAKPANGYKFIGWSGDATGSNASISVKMDRDKEISAEFFKDNGKPIYTLTITTTGSGVVIVDPQQTYYDSGTVVTLSIGLVGDGTFTGWGGALSGSDPAAVLTMNGNKTVTASFTGSDVEPSVNLVTNGDFADGETGWSFGAYENGKATGAIEGGLFKIATQSAGTEDWHIQLMQDGISLVKGERYTLSFEASAQTDATIIVNVGMEGEPYTSYSGNKKIQLTNQKQPYTISFNMKQDSDSNTRLEFNAGKCGASWQIDNIKLVKDIPIGVRRESPFFPGKDCVSPATRGGERVSVSLYDHAGRLVRQVSGGHSILDQRLPVQRKGSYIAVIRSGKSTSVRRIISLGR